MSDQHRPTDPQRASRREHISAPPRTSLHDERIGGEQFHVIVLSFVLIGTLAMLAYAAPLDSDHPGDWIVLGAIAATALGTVVAIKSR